MDFDSPDVMKDFPGLYASELKKKCSNDSDYSDENEKATKKDMLIGKRKDKKDKKDKEKGYAALEGESSDDASPCKSKKSKSFKFTKSKDKEKREKHRDKDSSEKKKDRTKKVEKKAEKEKSKKSHKLKHSLEETIDIADALPMFGVSLELAVDRSRCHDGLDIPLPIRECIDYVEAVGLAFEGVYKISGAKTKVSQIRKMYNHRQNVKLSDYDVPTATSLLKMFLRDLPEPIFTNELIIRFEEAGAILNLNTREKHLKNLVDTLPPLNKLLLSWLVIHLHNVTVKEHLNKMNKQSVAAALNHTFHVSSRLLQALLHHSRALFPDVTIYKYIPPLASGAQLPEKPQSMENELKKQESLLNQIHKEMNVGCNSKQREELLWEVQRIITQLKRKLKKVQKSKETTREEKSTLEAKPLEAKAATTDTVDHSQVLVSTQKSKNKDEQIPSAIPVGITKTEPDISANGTKVMEFTTDFDQSKEHHQPKVMLTDEEKTEPTIQPANKLEGIKSGSNEPEIPGSSKQELAKEEEEDDDEYSWDSDETSTDSDILEEYLYFDERLITLRVKNTLLKELSERLTDDIGKQKKEIEDLKIKINYTKLKDTKKYPRIPDTFEEIQNLLVKENQMLQIKKINLVREIMEQREMCVDLTARLKWAQKDTKEQKFLQCKQIIRQST